MHRHLRIQPFSHPMPTFLSLYSFNEPNRNTAWRTRERQIAHHDPTTTEMPLERIAIRLDALELNQCAYTSRRAVLVDTHGHARLQLHQRGVATPRPGYDDLWIVRHEDGWSVEALKTDIEFRMVANAAGEPVTDLVLPLATKPWFHRGLWHVVTGKALLPICALALVAAVLLWPPLTNNNRAVAPIDSERLTRLQSAKGQTLDTRDDIEEQAWAGSINNPLPTAEPIPAQ